MTKKLSSFEDILSQRNSIDFHKGIGYDMQDENNNGRQKRSHWASTGSEEVTVKFFEIEQYLRRIDHENSACQKDLTKYPG